METVNNSMTRNLTANKMIKENTRHNKRLLREPYSSRNWRQNIKQEFSKWIKCFPALKVCKISNSNACYYSVCCFIRIKLQIGALTMELMVYSDNEVRKRR